MAGRRGRGIWLLRLRWGGFREVPGGGVKEDREGCKGGGGRGLGKYISKFYGIWVVGVG